MSGPQGKLCTPEREQRLRNREQVLGTRGIRQKKNRKISDKCQFTSYPLPHWPNNDKTNSDKKLKV